MGLLLIWILVTACHWKKVDKRCLGDTMDTYGVCDSTVMAKKRVLAKIERQGICYLCKELPDMCAIAPLGVLVVVARK